MTRLAILGGGFMGGALADGLIDSGWSRGDILIAEKQPERRAEIERRLKVVTTDTASEAAGRCPTVLFAVKPQDIHTVLAEVAPVFHAERLAISICAGIRTRAFEDALGEVPVIRAMPNTPAAIGEGATAIAAGRYAREDDLATALNILSTVGKVVVVGEEQMDAVTAVSGTGPAYVFYLAEALIRAAQTQGLAKDQACVLVYQTLAGAAHLLMHDPAEAEELRARVTSPGGTTQAAIEYLESQRWAAIFEEAVDRACRRSKELGG